MITPREYHTATLLLNGKVLVAGGNTDKGNVFSSAELYDPSKGTWATTGSMTTPRWGHTATLLLNGQVLVEGGFDNNGHILSSAELYDPISGTWTPTGSMSTPRAWGQTATLLPNGQVLVAGGYEHFFDSCCTATATAELYDPSTGVWTATGSMSTGRTKHTATLLRNGTVLVAGGCSCDTAEIYDPSSGAWTRTQSMTMGRANDTATLLPNGQVLVAGGCGNGACSSAELYNPASGTWTATGSMTAARIYHTATLLSDGQVLVAGGYNTGCTPCTSLSSAELYDPQTGHWTPTGNMSTGHWGHAAIVFPNGHVLVMGGIDSTGNASADAQVFTPRTAVLLSPASLDFGDQLVNTHSLTQTVTLTNSGAVTITIGTIAVTGTNAGDFAASDTCRGISLAPNGTCTISASFAPTALGPRTATLGISDTAADSPQSIVLTGRGANTIISFDTTSLDLGTQRIGTRSAVHNVTVHNTGPGSLHVAGIAMIGANAGDFTAPNTCTGASIAVGGSCIISVSFAPTGGGPRSASLRITDDALHSPQSVALTGNGLLPATNTPTSTPTKTPTATATATPTTTPTRAPATAPLTVGRSQPAPLLFNLHVAPHAALSGQFLTVGVRTVPQAQVTIILRVLERRVVYRGRGQHRTRLVQMVALYTVRVQGTANGKGRFTRSLKITYQPRKPVQALLAASARMGHRTITRTTHVTIQPQRHQRKTHQR